MNQLKINTNYSNLNDLKLKEKADKILLSMTNNLFYKESIFFVKSLTKSIEFFSETRNVIIGYASSIEYNNNKSREDLLDNLKQLEIYVLSVAMDDEKILISSGFSLENKFALVL